MAFQNANTIRLPIGFAQLLSSVTPSDAEKQLDKSGHDFFLHLHKIGVLKQFSSVECILLVCVF